MRRASSSRARRTPTTSAFSTCVSSCAGEWRQRSRPLSCSTCCSRAARTCGLRRGAHARTARRAGLGFGPDAFCRRSPPGDHASECRPCCGQTPGRASPHRSARRREPRSSHCSPHSGSWNRIATRSWQRSCEQDRGAPTARRPTRAAHWSACGWPDTARGDRIARRRRRCRGRPVGKRRSGRRRAASTTTRLPRSPTSIEPTRSARAHPLTRCAAGRSACSTTSMPSSCRCPRTTRCSAGTIRRCATC